MSVQQSSVVPLQTFKGSGLICSDHEKYVIYQKPSLLFYLCLLLLCVSLADRLVTRSNDVKHISVELLCVSEPL